MYQAGLPGWRPGFSVTAAGSGSMNRSSRSARHRSSDFPNVIEPASVRTRFVHGGGMHWLTDASPENATRERDSGASRPATVDRSTPSRLTTALGRAACLAIRCVPLAPQPFPSLTTHRADDASSTCRSPPGHFHSVTCTFTFIDRHLPFLLQPFTSLLLACHNCSRDPSARHRCIPDAGSCRSAAAMMSLTPIATLGPGATTPRRSCGPGGLLREGRGASAASSAAAPRPSGSPTTRHTCASSSGSSPRSGPAHGWPHSGAASIPTTSVPSPDSRSRLAAEECLCAVGGRRPTDRRPSPCATTPRSRVARVLGGPRGLHRRGHNGVLQVDTEASSQPDSSPDLACR